MKPERRRQIEDLIESMDRGVTPTREVALEALRDLTKEEAPSSAPVQGDSPEAAFVFAQLQRGCCSPKQVEAKGCALCVMQHQAIAQVSAWLTELEALRSLRANLLAYSRSMAAVLETPSAPGVTENHDAARDALRQSLEASAKRETP